MKKIQSLSAATLFAFIVTFGGCKDKQPAPPGAPPAPSPQRSIPNPSGPLKPGELTPPPAK